MADLGFGDFLKEAFKVPYNLILFAGGMLAGIVSLHPLVFWPVVVGFEILYLTTLASNPRFQNVVRARHASRAAIAAQDVVPRLMSRLDRSRIERFERVRERCVALQRSLQGEERDAAMGILQGEQTQGVGKLLWVFLRTLAQEQILADFCATMPRKEIEQTLHKTESALASPGASEQLKTAYGENARVLRQRLDNLRRAEEHLEGISVRLVRVENSIMLIQEQALTRRDPAFVESEVKSVTEGLQSVEEVLRSIDLPQADPTPGQQAPDLTHLLGPVVRQKQ